MEQLICNKCGTTYSMKDNERFSSMKCECGILIFYYDSCYDVFVSKESYQRWKNEQSK